MQHFAVFGNPIAQSKSPFIHHLFAAQSGLDIQYDAVLVAKHLFAEATQAFFAKAQHIGLNVTVPFKEEAYSVADTLTAEARSAGAVNTLYKTDAGIVGHNTDGLGLVADILRQGQILKQQRVLIIGAGGAARGVIQPLLQQQVASIHIINRNVQRARDLVDFFADKKVTAGSFSSTAHEQYDVIINATTLSLQQQLPQIPATTYKGVKFAYDMVYLSAATVFMQQAQRAKVPVVSDGLGMLVGQAAESFTLWTGQQVDTAPVLAALREQLQANL
jgi:shikimate dehydrogenase